VSEVDAQFRAAVRAGDLERALPLFVSTVVTDRTRASWPTSSPGISAGCRARVSWTPGRPTPTSTSRRDRAGEDADARPAWHAGPPRSAGHRALPSRTPAGPLPLPVPS